VNQGKIIQEGHGGKNVKNHCSKPFQPLGPLFLMILAWGPLVCATC